jgi:hypothetical protein
VVGDSAIQVLQFRNLCRDSGGRADVFDNEVDAVRWFGPGDTASLSPFQSSVSSKPPR